MQTSRHDLPTSCPAPKGVTVIEDMINLDAKRSNPIHLSKVFIFAATNKYRSQEATGVRNQNL